MTGNPFRGGAISRIHDFESLYNNPASVEVHSLHGLKLKWPNILSNVPQSRTHLLLGDGFLVPGKSTGGIYLISADSKHPNDASMRIMTSSHSGHFYHKGEWIDMNADGRIDILTARAYKKNFFSSQFIGELVWLENDGRGLDAKGSWREHVVCEGPDVLFGIAELDGNKNTIEIIASEFFAKKLELIVVDAKTEPLMWRVTIDDSIGSVYSVQLVDLDDDGNKELLVNNHEDNKEKSAIFAYEIIPHGDIANEKISQYTFLRHTLASGFVVTEPGLHQATPGFPTITYITSSTNATNNVARKPYILLAGDGSQKAYLLRPTKESRFGYEVEVIVDVGGVVGVIARADINNDGIDEFFVPNYDSSSISVYTFAPLNSIDAIATH